MIRTRKGARGTYVRSQVQLLVFSGLLLLLLRFRRSSSFLFLLLGLLLSILLASLELRLGHFLASDLVQDQIGDAGLGFLNTGVGHGVLCEGFWI